MKYHLEQSFKFYCEDYSYYWEITEDPDGLDSIDIKYIDCEKETIIRNTISIPIELIDDITEVLKILKSKMKKDLK